MVKSDGETTINNALSIENASISGIPEIIPFRTTSLAFTGLFPGIIPSWTSLGTSPSGIVGTGTATIRTRTLADVSLTIMGPTTITSFGFGDAQAAYTVSWLGIIPDPGKFTWTLTLLDGRGLTETGDLLVTSTGQTSVVLNFAFPRIMATGTFQFNIAVNATETSVADGVTTLVAPTANLRVTLRVRKFSLSPLQPIP